MGYEPDFGAFSGMANCFLDMDLRSLVDNLAISTPYVVSHSAKMLLAPKARAKPSYVKAWR